MRALALGTPALRAGNATQRARLRGWLCRFTLAGVLLAACVWGWSGYQGSGAQVAIGGLWSLCGSAR